VRRKEKRQDSKSQCIRSKSEGVEMAKLQGKKLRKILDTGKQLIFQI
jgi:hypothetical protein